MAETFEIISSRQTKEIVGGHDLVDVWEVGAKTRPHGIYFAFRVPKDRYTPEHVGREAAGIAEFLGALREHPHVTGVAYVQTIGPNGSLVDELDVYYETADGKHRGELRTPIAGATVATLHAHLDDAIGVVHSIRDL